MPVLDDDSARPLVLIAEDSLLNLELYRRVFETLPVRTIEAANGKAALAAILQHRPDVLLIDLGLPVLSGIEVIRQVRMNGEFDTTKILAVTGQKDLKAANWTDSSVDAVIYKPFVIPDFVATLERLLAETVPSQG